MRLYRHHPHFHMVVNEMLQKMEVKEREAELERMNQIRNKMINHPIYGLRFK